MKRLPIVAALAMCAVAGCAIYASIEDTTTVAPDAGSAPPMSGDSGAVADPDDQVDSGPQVQPDQGDAGVLGGDGGAPPDGGSGTVACPKPTAFVPSLSNVVSKVCNATEGLVQGGDFTGLDCYGAGLETSRDGVSVTACVGFDYGSAKLDAATIRLFAVGKGCTYDCYSGGCDTTATARVFVGKDRTFGNWTKAGFAKVSSTRENYTFEVPAGDFSVIAVCRSGAGSQYEDLGVDGVAASCR